MKTAALQPPFTRRASAVLHALTLTSVAGFSLAQQSPAPLVLMAAVSLAAWLLVESPSGSRTFAPPTWLLNIVVLVGACVLWRDVSDDLVNVGQSPIAGLAQFILVLLACKLFERKTRRDVAQIIILTFLVLVAAAMLSASSILSCVILVLYLSLLAYAASLIHLREEAQNLPASLLAGVLPRDQISLDAVRRDVRTIAGNIFLMALPIAVVIFMLTPRTRGPAVLSSWSMGRYQTGYSETVQFQNQGTLVPSDTVVMNVHITRNGVDGGSRYEEPYFRGAVLNEYSPERQNWTHEHWSREEKETRTRDIPLNVTLPPTPTILWGDDSLRSAPSDEMQEYTVFVQSSYTLFSMAPPLAFESQKSSMEIIHFIPVDMTLDRSNGITLPIYYTVYSRPGLDLKEGSSTPFVETGILRKNYAEARSDSPPPLALSGPRPPGWKQGMAVIVSAPVTKLARDLAGGLLGADNRPTGPEKIEPIVRTYERYLKETYPYSLSFQQVDPMLDPTTDFLLNRKSAGGHCEYFASALVMLCRAVGINARMVAGYHGGEYNSITGLYVVRERDAHTWTEFYLPGTGWTISDPTPAQTGLNSSTGTMGVWLRDMFQFIQNTWLTLVVTFDDDSRRSVAQWISLGISRAWESVSDIANAIKTGVWDGRIAMLDRLLMLASLGGLGGIAVWLLRRWKRHVRHILPGGAVAGRRATRPAGDIAFLDDLLRMLERGSAPRALHQTPREFSLQFAGKLGDARNDAQWLIDTAYASRFGMLPMDSAKRRQIALALTRVRAAMGH